MNHNFQEKINNFLSTSQIPAAGPATDTHVQRGSHKLKIHQSSPLLLSRSFLFHKLYALLTTRCPGSIFFCCSCRNVRGGLFLDSLLLSDLTQESSDKNCLGAHRTTEVYSWLAPATDTVLLHTNRYILFTQNGRSFLNNLEMELDCCNINPEILYIHFAKLRSKAFQLILVFHN